MEGVEDGRRGGMMERGEERGVEEEKEGTRRGGRR